MKIGFCQFDVKYKDINANMKTIEKMIDGVDAELIVLPELALSGYYFKERATLARFATKDVNQPFIEQMRKLCENNGFSVVVGLAEAKGEALYNTAYLIDHTGVVGKHRKMHLTDIESVFTPGETIDVFELNGVKIGLAICFDTWFPEMIRALVDKGADVLCVPANFGGPWTLDVVKVRALENSLPVILSNRIGSEMIDETEEAFRGESMVVDGYGNPLLRAFDQPHVGIVDIDLKGFSRNRSLICSRMEEERNKHKNNSATFKVVR